MTNEMKTLQKHLSFRISEPELKTVGDSNLPTVSLSISIKRTNLLWFEHNYSPYVFFYTYNKKCRSVSILFEKNVDNQTRQKFIRIFIEADSLKKKKQSPDLYVLALTLSAVCLVNIYFEIDNHIKIYVYN